MVRIGNYTIDIFLIAYFQTRFHESSGNAFAFF